MYFIYTGTKIYVLYFSKSVSTLFYIDIINAMYINKPNFIQNWFIECNDLLLRSSSRHPPSARAIS